MATSIATTALRAAKAALRGEMKKRIANMPHEEQLRQSNIITEKVRIKKLCCAVLSMLHSN